MVVSRPIVAAVVLVLVAPDGPDASPQGSQNPPPAVEGGRVAIGSADVSRYEVMYGADEFRTLEEDAANWPSRTAIRTVGRLERILGRREGASSSFGTQGQGRLLWDNRLARYRICGERWVCVALVPVEELAGIFDGPAQAWLDRDIEVTGAIDEIRTQGNSVTAFQVWSVYEVPDRPARSSGSKGSTLEPLVRYPEGAQGRMVTVQGRFRGANLFEDLEPESRRRASDWVLQDGPFSIWVTGKAPKGKDFSLDPTSRADCIYRLSVTGVVETENDYVYLRATAVQLLGRAR
jgi:hypothetical protein